MTQPGTFVVNGTERVIVSRRCTVRPACSSIHDRARHILGKFCSPASFPYRGSWLDFGIRRQGHRVCAHRRRRKLPVTTLLGAGNKSAAAKLAKPGTFRGRALNSARHVRQGWRQNSSAGGHTRPRRWTTLFVERLKGHTAIWRRQDRPVVAEAGTKMTPPSPRSC